MFDWGKAPAGKRREVHTNIRVMRTRGGTFRETSGSILLTSLWMFATGLLRECRKEGKDRETYIRPVPIKSTEKYDWESRNEQVTRFTMVALRSIHLFL